MAVYSHSGLSSYEKCPRKFAYRYIEKTPAQLESIESFIGKRVHEILERIYLHLARYKQPPRLSQVLDRYEQDCDTRWHEKVHIVRREMGASEYRQRGRQCLEHYFHKHYPFEDSAKTVGIEERLRIPLDPEERYVLRGIADRIVRSAPGNYEIHDYKTGTRSPSRKQLAEDRQLAFYQIGLQKAQPDAQKVTLVYHYLQTKRTLITQREPEQIAALCDATMALIDTIETAREFPARPGPLCPWCEYRPICPETAQNGATARESASEGAAPRAGEVSDAATSAQAGAMTPASAEEARQLPLF